MTVSRTLEPQPEVPTRLQGRWLVMARAVWLVVTLVTIGLFVASIPTYFTYLESVCFQTACPLGPDYVPDKRTLEAFGLSPSLYAAAIVAIEDVFAVVHFVVASIIFWRASSDRLALLGSLFLVTWGATFSNSFLVLGEVYPTWQLLTKAVTYLGGVFLYAFFSLFPDGRLIPRWLVGPLVGWAVLDFLGIFLPSDSPLNPGNWPPAFLIFGFLVSSLIFIQIYRYRRVSNPEERQRTKWVVFGMAAALSGFLMLVVLGATVAQGRTTPVAGLVVHAAFYGFMLLIPLSISVAILRARLWDVDLLIRRTIIYAVLTATLASLYFGGVVLLQQLFRAILGEEQSQLATVISTLAIAGMFFPLRRRVQDAIDRRFYRRKYDAAKTLAEFAATVRNETDLDKLAERLMNVVDETLQPENVSLWLKPTKDSRWQPVIANAPGDTP